MRLASKGLRKSGQQQNLVGEPGKEKAACEAAYGGGDGVGLVSSLVAPCWRSPLARWPASAPYGAAIPATRPMCASLLAEYLTLVAGWQHAPLPACAG